MANGSTKIGSGNVGVVKGDGVPFTGLSVPPLAQASPGAATLNASAATTAPASSAGRAKRVFSRVWVGATAEVLTPADVLIMVSEMLPASLQAFDLPTLGLVLHGLCNHYGAIRISNKQLDLKYRVKALPTISSGDVLAGSGHARKSSFLEP
jgi:hypothetical protein